MNTNWLQVNCSLFFCDSTKTDYIPWISLYQVLKDWKERKLLKSFFFTRKAPGLRLRFYADEPEISLNPELVAWLEESEKLNHIRGFRFAIYEPEIYRFGGKTGTAIAHKYFDYDSWHTILYEILPESIKIHLKKEVFSLISINDLFLQSIEDRSELWDIWKQLQVAICNNRDCHSSLLSDYEISLEMLQYRHEYISELPESAKILLYNIKQSNAHIIKCLRAAEIGSDLDVGTRAWMVAVSVFHWNRLGFTTNHLQPMILKMIEVLS